MKWGILENSLDQGRFPLLMWREMTGVCRWGVLYGPCGRVGTVPSIKCGRGMGPRLGWGPLSVNAGFLTGLAGASVERGTVWTGVSFRLNHVGLLFRGFAI